MRHTAILLTLLLATSDIDQRLARWQPVKMPFDASGLSTRERQMVQKLVEASQYLDNIYWRQSDPEDLALYRSTRDEKLKRLLMIHGGRFDLIDDNHPFAGTEPMPPGRALYPKGLTREQIEQYVKDHAGKKDEIYSPYTVIERRGNELIGRPYHEVYRAQLEPMVKALREAAAAQFIYLVLFSSAFFFKGFTGLAITIGAIVTLFVVMQATGRIKWSEKFASYGVTPLPAR